MAGAFGAGLLGTAEAALAIYLNENPVPPGLAVLSLVGLAAIVAPLLRLLASRPAQDSLVPPWLRPVAFATVVGLAGWLLATVAGLGAGWTALTVVGFLLVKGVAFYGPFVSSASAPPVSVSP